MESQKKVLSLLNNEKYYSSNIIKKINEMSEDIKKIKKLQIKDWNVILILSCELKNKELIDYCINNGANNLDEYMFCIFDDNNFELFEYLMNKYYSNIDPIDLLNYSRSDIEFILQDGLENGDYTLSTIDGICNIFDIDKLNL